ncbi:MAG: dephospho-CoA kinase, partial [Acutalibacteraceae bacterium]
LYEKEQAGVPVIVLDAPQLFEAGCERYCGAVCVVTAPADIRLQRLEQRDALPRELLEKRMQAQLDEGYLREKADFVIDGSQPLTDVHRQVQKVWRACCRIAGC